MVRLPYPKIVLMAAMAAASPLAAAKAQTAQRTPQFPVTLQDAEAAKAAQEQQAAQGAPNGAAQPGAATADANQGWSEAEIETARARCNAIIAQYDATATPMPPIREGDCGAPHPVQLTRVGSVTLTQPATVTCDVISVLGDWLKVDVQPAAKQYLGGKVTALEVLSSYSCRNAYGRKRTRLSEHGKANAIDIKAFHIDRQAAVDLTADWGMTERDIKAQIAAAEAAAKAQAAARAKAEAEALAQAQAEARARGAKPQDGNAVAGTRSADRGYGLAPNSEGLSGLRGMVRELGKGDEDREPTGLSLGQPSRLGGPKAKSEAQAAAPAAPSQTQRSQSPNPNGYSAKQMFLRAIHASACKRFGTVLGPEANEAHRNHFHLDVADRHGRGSFCE